MTMDSQLKAQVVFHLTGRRSEGDASEVALTGLRPVLFAPYRHLDSLRHDFPLLLPAAGPAGARSLTSVIDELLREVAPQGVAGEGSRRRVLQVEREIRRLVSGGATGRLSELWDRAVESLSARMDEGFRRDVARAREALSADGAVVGCDAGLPRAFVSHVWTNVQQEKARSARERITGLVIRLGDILRADFMRSDAALQRSALQASFGAVHREFFDFDAMSRLLSRGGREGGLGQSRRARIEWSLSVLREQRFFPAALRVVEPPREAVTHEFSFDSTGAALQAFRARMPELVELLKALQVAELEVDGRYSEDLHDPIFDAFDEQAVTAQDLAFFPDYLVCAAREDAARQGGFAEALASGVPIKLMVQVEDLLEEGAVGSGHHAFGVRGTQLAQSAMSLGELFVMQSVASNLLQLGDRVERGMRFPGAALFCIYSPPDDGSAVPAYLRGAAAMQSRAFPAFSYDPAAGDDVASRFALENNPQPERDWPVERLSYADQDLQAVAEDVAFTFADFAAGESRCARHFSLAPRTTWGDAMTPVQYWLDHIPQDPSTAIPYVLAVDEADLLCRLVVDDRLMRAAIRCRESWHRLQELGGIRDARTERALARERQAWEEEHRRELEAAVAKVASASTTPVAPAPAEPEAVATASPAAQEPEPEPERNPDEPYIETIRCSTCNECTQINPRMFAYNDNKQAYIADLKAGTYKEMVEAAESCQVSVIHPGKPWNPDEPGLEELIERAKPFI